MNISFASDIDDLSIVIPVISNAFSNYADRAVDHDRVKYRFTKNIHRCKVIL
jgi:hypothetical protein